MSIIFITDIPAPYRVELYNTMAESLDSLEVWYFQKESKSRPWKYIQKNMKHRFWIAGGLYARLGYYNLFINPNLILKLLVTQPKQIILAAGWNDFDVMCIVMFKRLGLIRTKIGFWSEANHLTVGASNDNRLKFWIRRFVYNTCDGIQLISGEMTRRTFEIWKVNVEKEVYFPNTIQEQIHENLSPSKDKNNEQIFPTILIVARLAEKLKGLLNFLEALSDEQIKMTKIIIAGEGEDRKKIVDLIDRRRLQKHVVLLGQLNSHDLANVYSQVDAFCLPSFSDASPLAVIEALNWGLPLLISNRCGNHFEAVKPGINGLTFNPLSPEEISVRFNDFINMKSEWEEMGRQSLKIFVEKFQKEMIIKNFIKNIIDE